MEASAEAKDGEWETKNDVPLDKTWTIEFNTSIQSNEENEEFIYVTDESGTEINNDITIDENKITVGPPENEYAEGTTYTLHIEEGVSSTSGIPSDKTVTMPFTTEDSYTFKAGEWTRNTEYNEAFLNVKQVTDGTFDFTLNAVSGAHTGLIEGTATISGEEATYSDEQGCTLTFTNPGDTITVSQTDECSWYGGAGVVFSGDYTKGDTTDTTPRFVEVGLFTDSENEAFKSLVGDHYNLFTDSFQVVTQEDVADDFGGEAYSGFVRGVVNSMNGIVVKSDNGEIYAATLGNVEAGDYMSEEGILYFTTDKNHADHLPKTILKWKNNLMNNENVYYMNDSGAAYFDEEFAQALQTGKIKHVPFQIGDSMDDVKQLFGDKDEIGYNGSMVAFYDNLSFAYGHELNYETKDTIQVIYKTFKESTFTAEDVKSVLGPLTYEGVFQKEDAYVLRYDFTGPENEYKSFFYLEGKSGDSYLDRMNIIKK
ncbi:Ig-like domain-containing protein [Pontibacillus sp. ALD_SL1]|uniref:Ig-like domain-containing protein n=1 Tax=Pontibacillus sp. ALD_SL1 TaxID=2777185 RepID=UPI001A96D0FC|nr:Ig-like domain-containing protein [Pontibacillus sp. ALD_SL1]QSS99675.1 Ig-like domain-containing protein [Pontibacillus sp. ALD_SL1]